MEVTILNHSEIKPAIAQEKHAIYKGAEYTVHGVRGFKAPHKQDINYSVELLDKNKNCIIYADLKDVELIGG